MKLFKQLLVAPAALGLVAPLAVSAQDVASLNGMSAVNEYMNQQDVDRFRAWESKNQVTSVNQFSDVRPTDWAYQALSNLVEKYGCVAGYPNGTYKGGQAMTRFEAAALLNACLDRVTEQTDELKRLMDEFQQELTVLRGRVDGLEKKVGKLEAMQFSTTTKLQGEATMVLGGVGYSATGPNNTVLGASAGTAARNAVSFNYDVRLNLNTSFTGKDLLFTRLRSANFGGSAFAGSPVGMSRLDKSSSDGTSNAQQNVFIDRLFYRFPIGSELTAIIGPRVRNTEMITFRPQAYNADVLDFFTLAGAPGAYNKATGTGFGIEWKQKVKKGQPYLVASANYVAENGQNGNPNSREVADNGGGLFNAYSVSNVTVQLGGRGTNWGVAALYRYGTCGTNLRDGTVIGAGRVACGPANSGSTNSLGLGAFWQPKQTGWIPSISLGWGYTGFSQSVAVTPNQTSVNNVSAAQSWSAMFQWNDAFAKGNAAGFALGQGAMATALRNGTPNDSNYAFEWFYRFRVSNNITVTPAIFYLSNPNGQQATGNNAFNNTGVLVQTQFRF
jgi:hypothetical protein